MDLYDGLGKLYNHLTRSHYWTEDDASRFVDGILHDNRSRKAQEVDLAWTCYNMGCLEVIGGIAKPAQGLRWTRAAWCAGETTVVARRAA